MRKPSSASGAGAPSDRLATDPPVPQVDRSHTAANGAARQGTKLEFQATSPQPSLKIIDLLREYTARHRSTSSAVSPSAITHQLVQRWSSVLQSVS